MVDSWTKKEIHKNTVELTDRLIKQIDYFILDLPEDATYLSDVLNLVLSAVMSTLATYLRHLAEEDAEMAENVESLLHSIRSVLPGKPYYANIQ